MSAIVITFLLLFILCLHAGASDGGRVILKRTVPVYPELAHQMHLGGGVMLAVSIAPDGNVSDVKAQSGHPLLIQSAIDAVRQWKYAPATQATEATVLITFQPR